MATQRSAGLARLDTRGLCRESAVGQQEASSISRHETGYAVPPHAPPRPMRIALLTLEALASAAPVRRFVADHADRIALVALSDPFRPQRGGTLGQARIWSACCRGGPQHPSG